MKVVNDGCLWDAGAVGTLNNDGVSVKFRYIAYLHLLISPLCIIFRDNLHKISLRLVFNVRKIFLLILVCSAHDEDCCEI